MAPSNVELPWRDAGGEMYLSDVEILEFVYGRGVATPRDVARSRYRENVIRLQCRHMRRGGLLRSPAHDAFALASEGEDFLDGDRSLPATGGYFERDALLEVPDRHLRDFSALDPTDVKLTNEGFLESSSHDYGFVRNEREWTRRRIWNTKGWKLARIMTEFPLLEPLAQQCAHWIRAFVGVHFFPDANHRTAMSTLYGVLDANSVAPPNDEWPPAGIDRAVVRSKLLRSLHTVTDFRTLWLRDELYHHWHRFFRNSLHDVSNGKPVDPSEKYLRTVLEYAREKRIHRI